MAAFEFIFVENISIPVPNTGIGKCLTSASMCEPRSETERMWDHLGMDFGSFRTFYVVVLKVGSVFFLIKKNK